MTDEYETFIKSHRQLCETCHSRLSEDGKTECFRCRVLSVGFAWRGGGFNFGRHNFHDRTNAEFVAEHVGEVKNNPNIERSDPL